VVRHHVVQLAGDARTFPFDRAPLVVPRVALRRHTPSAPPPSVPALHRSARRRCKEDHPTRRVDRVAEDDHVEDGGRDDSCYEQRDLETRGVDPGGIEDHPPGDQHDPDQGYVVHGIHRVDQKHCSRCPVQVGMPYGDSAGGYDRGGDRQDAVRVPRQHGGDPPDVEHHEQRSRREEAGGERDVGAERPEEHAEHHAPGHLPTIAARQATTALRYRSGRSWVSPPARAPAATTAPVIATRDPLRPALASAHHGHLSHGLANDRRRDRPP